MSDSTATAILATDTAAFGPDGHCVTLSVGAYPIYPADGVPESVLYLLDPADPRRIVGCVDASTVERS